MSFTSMNRLAFKLPAFVAAMIVFVAASLTILTYFSVRAATIERAKTELKLVALKRGDALENWFEMIEMNALTIANNPSTIDAATTLGNLWKNMEAGDRADLIASYTTQNPFEKAKRSELDRAEGKSMYNNFHARYHGYMRYFNNVNEYYDVFIVNPEGEIIYSVTKEADFGQNVVTGALANTGIGQTFQMSLKKEDATTAHMSPFDPYSVSGGAIAAFASARIMDAKGELAGVLVLQVNHSSFAALMNDSVGLGETTETYIVRSNGQMIVDSRLPSGPRALETIEMTDHIKEALTGKEVTTTHGEGLTHTPVFAYAMPVSFDGVDYALVAEKPNKAIFAALYKQRNISILMSLVAAVVLSGLSWMYIRGVTGRLERVGRDMQSIADGDYETGVSEARTADEIGDIRTQLVDFQSKLAAAAALEQEQKKGQIEQQQVLDTLRAGLVRLAEGDLSLEISEAFNPLYESLRSDFNETQRTLSVAIANVIEAAGSIQQGANEISQASDDLSNRTENQAATLEETAAALDELTASVKSAADGAKSVEKIVVEAQSEAEESGKIVGDAIAAMTEIEKSSEHISQIIGVIDDIAFQTNLLALNAGVEAARAGEAGKGFAVVASEVRALAQRSSEAAKEIKVLISGSAKQVERGVDLVGGAGTALGSIVQRVTHISELVRSMATGTSEQSVGLGEINLGVNQLDQVTQQNAAMVEEATAASHVLKRDATRLQEMVGNFKTLQGSAEGSERISSRRRTPAANVEHVEFQPAEEVSFESTPAEIPVARKATGTSNASAMGDWIDF